MAFRGHIVRDQHFLYPGIASWFEGSGNSSGEHIKLLLALIVG